MSKSRTDSRIVFMGMRGAFSRISLQRFLAADVTVRAVVVPAAAAAGTSTEPVRRLDPVPASSEIPLVTRFVEPSVVHLAWERDVPVLEVGRLPAPETLSALASYQPDVICVACFNRRFPPALLDLPRFGCVNLHPSLLPAYRGPAPLFWAFRNGERETGVTVHLIDEGMDTGAILRQQPLPIPDGIRGDVLERQCAALGGELMVEAVGSLVTGTVSPTAQPEEGSYYPWPSAEDFEVPTRWPARRAFNFVRGVAHWDGPLVVQAGERWFVLQDAVSFVSDEALGEPFIREGRELWVQCTPGVLHAELREQKEVRSGW